MMRSRLYACLAAFGLLVSSSAMALSLDDVKAMAAADVPDSIIVQTIANAEDVFNLSASDIVELKKAGVSDAVIEALQATAGSVSRTTETRDADPPPRRSGDDEPRARSTDDEPRARSTDDEPRARSTDDESRGDDEDDGLIRRRRGGDEDEDDGDDRRSTSGKTPKELKRAISAINDRKYLTGTLELWKLIESQKYPEQDAKAKYYLGKGLLEMGLLHSAQVQFQDVVKAGPAAGSVFTNALGYMVDIADRTNDPIYLIRTIDGISPEDYPGKVKDDLYYYQGVRDFERGEFARAKRSFARLGRSNKHYIQARYHIGVIDNSEGRKKSAVKTFTGIVKGDFRADAEVVTRIRQLSVINLARIQYGIQQYGRAIGLYEKLAETKDPRLQEFWPTALYESAWAYFMAENKESKALGNIMTLRSGFFDKTWLPEARILEALTYYRICEYRKVEDLLDSFVADYKPLQDRLSELLAPYEAGERPPRDLYRRLYGSDSKEFNKLPAAAYTRIEANREFAGPHNRVLQIEKELRDVAAQKPQWRDSEAGKGVEDMLKKQRKVYMKFAGAALAKQLTDLRDDLGGLLGQEALIRFEIINGLYKNYADKFRNPEAADVEEKVEFDFATNPDLIFWPFNGEFWADELGAYERVEPGDCKE